MAAVKRKFQTGLPQEAKSGGWNDQGHEIAASAYRCPWSDGGVEEEVDSIQTGYSDERQAQNGEAMQKDRMHSTAVVSEQSEEPERGAVSGNDARNNAKAPCVEGRPGVEDSMDCGDEILGDTNPTVECQPLLRQPQGT